MKSSTDLLGEMRQIVALLEAGKACEAEAILSGMYGDAARIFISVSAVWQAMIWRMPVHAWIMWST